MDPWRGGAGVSCREAVHQKREEYFVYEWAITSVQAANPLQLGGVLAGLNAVASGVDPYPYLN